MSNQMQDSAAQPDLTPEEVVEHVRALRARIREWTPLTPDQRNALVFRSRMSESVLHASISAIDALEIVSLAIATPAAELRELQATANRWTAAEDEVRSLLAGISGANMVRRQRIVFLASQGAGIASRLARDPAHAILRPHVEEIKRLRRLERRRKPAPAPESPVPETPTPPADVE